MVQANPTSTIRLEGGPIYRTPIHPLLAPFPIACFIGSLATDIAYWATDSVMWETFSIWLLTVGLIVAVFAVIAGFIDLIGGRGVVRRRRAVWWYAIGYAVALILSIINAFVHSRDGYTAVVPQGLILSGVVVLILLFTGWIGYDMAHRNRGGVAS